MLLALLRAAHRATAGDRAPKQPLEAGVLDSPMKSRATGSDVAERTARHRRKPLIPSLSKALSKAVFLRARVEAGISTSTAGQSKPRFHFNASMAIMRLWQSDEAPNVAYLSSLRKQTFQMHGSFRSPLLAQSRQARAYGNQLTNGNHRL